MRLQLVLHSTVRLKPYKNGVFPEMENFIKVNSLGLATRFPIFLRKVPCPPNIIFRNTAFHHYHYPNTLPRKTSLSYCCFFSEIILSCTLFPPNVWIHYLWWVPLEFYQTCNKWNLSFLPLYHKQTKISIFNPNSELNDKVQR